MRRSESGSIFTVLLGGVAILGLLSMAAWQFMSGPLASISRVTQHNLVKSQIQTIGRIAIMDATNQAASGDCDADGFIEPRPWRDSDGAPAPVRGGLIPLDMGAPTNDPWGSEYGYCVWDTGPLSADAGCGSGDGRLDGADNPTAGNPATLTVLAIVSPGQDRTFQTACNDYEDGDTDLIETEGDDVVQRFTYMEASSATSSLWTLKADDPETAAINKNLEIGEDIAFDTSSGLIQALAINATGKIVAGGGLTLGDQTVVTSCTAMSAGTMRYNTALAAIETCAGAAGWISAGGGSGTSWPLLAPDGSAATPSYAFENYDDIGLSAAPAALTLSGGGADFRVVSTGGMQIGHTAIECDSTIEGTLRYDAPTDQWSYCNGTSWLPFERAASSAWDRRQIGGITADSSMCGIKANGSAWCWGWNAFGQLGNGEIGITQSAPVPVSGGGTWTAISTSGSTCGIKSDGSAWCWGNSSSGQLGNGENGTNQSVPVPLTGGGTWTAISSGNGFNCGIKSDGSAWCWGGGSNGRLGNGGTTDSNIPVAVSGDELWTAISAGATHTCGITTERGEAWCWGGGSYGRLGNGSSANRNIPVRVDNDAVDDVPWTAISAGNTFTCGITADGAAWCWGQGTSGQLGNGGTASSQEPVEVSGGGTWAAISARYNYACGIKSDGSAWCWGQGSGGKLGNGDTIDQSTPVPVAGDGPWTAISAGNGNSCGVKADGSAWCWGGVRGSIPVAIAD